MGTKTTVIHKCDICGRKVRGEGADPYKHYNKFQWITLTYTSIGHDPMDSGHYPVSDVFDVCPDCIEPVQKWLRKTMQRLQD